MRLIPLVGVLLPAIFAAACDRAVPGSPTAPTPMAPLPSPAILATWNLTTTLTSVTGPDNCFTRDQSSRIGAPTEWLLGVQRGDTAVTLRYDLRNYPTDHVDYAARLARDEFVGRSEPWAVTFPDCADGTLLRGQFSGEVSGRFLDGTRLTATEVWVYRFTSGEVRLKFDWSAHAQ